MVQYDPSAELAPAFEFPPWLYSSQNDTDYVPTVAEPIFAATTTYELGVFFDTFKDGTNRAAFNNITCASGTGPFC